MRLDERFPGDELDREVWYPYYLPHWSSHAASKATYRVLDAELELSIPVDQGLWCSDLHPERLRVSCIQSGNIPWSQPFRDDLEVSEEGTEFRGFLPTYGRVGIRMRGDVTARSMFAFWLSGIEDTPERSGEICVAEIFGSGIERESAEIGIGLHSFRDPGLAEDFTADPMRIDTTRYHDYEVMWRPGSVAFWIDGSPVRQVEQAPDYPVQLMIGVFDFPDRQGDSSHEPRMWVSHVWSEPID